MKNLRCIIDSDEKLVSLPHGHVNLIKDKMYRSSEVTERYPQYFVEDNASAVTVITKEDLEKPIKKERKPRQKKEQPQDQKVIKEVLIELNDKVSLSEKISSFIPVKKDVKKIKPEVIKKEENKPAEIGFSWNRFLLLIGATGIIAFISAYLRIHGVATIFKLDLTIATIVVIGFIISEFAIGSLLLREAKSKLHHVMNFVILGAIQLILVAMAFVFEFSTMSNWLLTQKNEVAVMDKQESMYEDSLKDYDSQIKALQMQIDITPMDQITRRSYLTSKLITLTNRKNAKREEISTMYKDVNVTDKKVNRTGMENTAKVIGVSEEVLTKGIVTVVAGILNILYLFLMYGFLSEWKRRRA